MTFNGNEASRSKKRRTKYQEVKVRGKLDKTTNSADRDFVNT